MAGGYWGKGNNPYWNFDSDASLRNSQMNDAYKLANNAQIDTIKAQSDASLARSKANMANIEISDLRNQLNTTINSHKKEIDAYEKRLKNTKTVVFKLAIRSNIFERTLVKLTEEWSDKKDYILDEIQCQKNLCSTQEYRDNWWGWVNQEDPSSDHSYLDFPFPERELKNKP
ncbi:hypothetical protein AH553_22395 [Salmonella enterica subsp. diarizonae]|uniref:hypothetical protein n=1 Tax=Salmonella enterica TaxID=28901 RepID=UPI0009AA4674|nr:hypothetical protein [Salmonella enterica]EDM1757872.1 hypothetical protein [Salmonella enterica subsp. diarizonae]